MFPQQIPRCLDIAHEQRSVKRSVPRFIVLKVDRDVRVFQQDRKEGIS